MGAKRVKGIVVEIGGNTTGLDKALQGTNKQLGTTQNTLKDVERLLKLDPTNTQLLEQKQKLLAEAIGQTQDKLAVLNEANDKVRDSVKNYDAWKAAYDPIQEEIDTTKQKLKELRDRQSEMKDCGEIDTDAYEKLTEEIQDTSKELRDLKDRAKAVNDQFGNPVSPEQFDALQREIVQTQQDLQKLEDKAEDNFRQIGDAVDTAKEKLKKLGDTAGTVKDKAGAISDGFQPVTTAVAGVAAAAVATVPGTEELREDLSRLDANARENAVSVEAAREAWKAFAVQSGETDSAVEATANLLQAGFTESNLQKAVEGLAGAAQRFPDTLKVESLADSLQETLATGAATGQFAELMDRLGISTDDFSASLAQCATDAEKQDLVLQTLADAGLNKSYEAWKSNNEEMLRSKEANLELELSMAQLAEKVLPYITDLTEKMSEFIDWFVNLPEPAQGAIVAIMAVVGSISPLAGAVSNVAGLVEKFSKGDLPGLTGAFDFLTGTVLPGVQGAFSSVFSFIAANPIVLLIAAVVGMVAKVAMCGDEMQAKLQEFDDFLQQGFARDWTEVFGPVLGGALNNFFDFAKGIWDGLKQVLDGIIDFIRGVFTGDWERAWKGVVGIFEGIFTGLATLLKQPLNAVIRMVNGAIDGINWLIEGANKIPGVEIPRIEASLPYLANGGEVLQGSAIVGEAGPELLTVTPGKTIVQPLSNNVSHRTTHMGGITLNVYGAPGQDEEELADRVAERLQQQIDSEEAGL